MTHAMTRAGQWRGMAFLCAAATLVALLVPLAGPAGASHPSGCSLEILEEVDFNPTGSAHTLTAVLFFGPTGSSAGCDVSTQGVQIDFEVEQGPAIRACTPTGGAGDACPGGAGQPATGSAIGQEEGNSPQQPDLSCDMATSGTSQERTRCSVFFTSDSVGTNLIRGWIDHDKLNNSVEADPTEGRYSGASDCAATDNNPRSNTPTTGTNGCSTGPTGAPLTAEPGNTEPDTTDVVQKTWTQTVVGPTCVDLDPNREANPTGSDHILTATVTNQASRTAGSTEDPSDDSCTGSGSTLRVGVEVELEITDDDPNAFFVSVNGQSTNPAAGGPNRVTCTTDASGQCTAVIRTVNPAATGENGITARVPGSSSGSSQTETVTKTWASASSVGSVDVTPEEDTNPIGQPHVLTARVRNSFGEGLQNVRVIFQVTSGINQNRDLDDNPATPPGFIDQCTTTAGGICSVDYVSTVMGDDVITGCIDSNADFQCTNGDPAAPNPPNEANSGNSTTGDINDDQVLKHWVGASAGPARIALDMEACDGDLSNPAAASWNPAAAPNSTSNDRKDAHPICAAAFAQSANTLTRTRITFTITSGPGRFVVPSTTSQTFTQGSSRDLGTVVTVEPGTCAAGAGGSGTPANAPTTGTGTGSGSYNCVFLLSSATGTTAIRACLEGTNVCTTGSKPWQVNPADARNVTITPRAATNLPGSQHQFTAKVTDRLGGPVPGVAVTWSTSGEGTTVSQESTTDSGGEARIVITSQVEGTTTVTASITNSSTPNQCGQPAGTPSGAPAGNCTTTATKTWSNEPASQCSDGDDNDGDGEIDHPDDPGCTDADDDDETNAAPATCRNRGPNENVIVGTPGDDTLTGTSGRDVICGAGGNDSIRGLGGNDLIAGNGGNDSISGGGGKDLALGHAGSDDISGNSGNDSLKGGGGNDDLAGNGGIDTLSGGAGSDELLGGAGEDILKGGGGNDALAGGGSDDALDGGAGRDRCSGGPGTDRLRRCE